MNILMIPMYSKNICFFSCFLVLQPQEKKDEDKQPQEERSDFSVLFSHLPGSGSVVSLWGGASNFNGIKPIYQSLPLLELSGWLLDQQFSCRSGSPSFWLYTCTSMVQSRQGTWTTTDTIRLARMCKTWNCVFSVVSLSK